jgi:hypothetical protein
MDREPLPFTPPELTAEQQAELIISDLHYRVYHAIQDELHSTTLDRTAQQAKLNEVGPLLLRFADNIFSPAYPIRDQQSGFSYTYDELTLDEMTMDTGTYLRRMTNSLDKDEGSLEVLYRILSATRSQMEQEGLIYTQSYKSLAVLQQNLMFIYRVSLRLLRYGQQQ